jgi:hypothetical protein
MIKLKKNYTLTNVFRKIAESNWPPLVSVRVLIVGGGGGGGSDMGGGGGAGGYIAAHSVSIIGLVEYTDYPIIIGAGGAGAPAGTIGPAGTNGQNTTAFGLIAIGGGGGASDHDSAAYPAGNGGSGGGGSGGRGSGTPTYGSLAGTGTIGQGFDGSPSGTTWYPGGGGGAAAPGANTPGDGGAGLANDILGTNYFWAGGGGGAGYSGRAGNGGAGGGGGGGPKVSGGGLGNTQGLNPGSDATVGTLVSQTNVPGGNGGTNTGGGGGGGSHYNATNNGGSGGSGVVAIRYAGPLRASGGTIMYSGNDVIHLFTSSGIFNITGGSDG